MLTSAGLSLNLDGAGALTMHHRSLAFSHLSRRGVLAVLAALGMAAPGVGFSQEDKPLAPRSSQRRRPNLNDFMHEPLVRDCAISPDGETIAVLRRVEVDDGQKNHVSIHSVADFDNPRQALLNYDAAMLEWVSNDTLSLLRPGYITSLGPLLVPVPPGLAFLQKDDDAFWEYTSSAPYRQSGLFLQSIVDTLDAQPDHLLAHFVDRQGRGSLYNLNIRDGSVEPVETGTPDTVSWLAQDGRVVLRMDMKDNVSSIHRRAESGAWELVRKLYKSQFQIDDFTVVGVDDEPGVVLVTARAEGHDKRSLHRFDLKTMQWGGTVAQHPDFDVEGCFTDKRGRYVAASFIDDKVRYIGRDPNLASDLSSLETRFPAHNLVIYDISADGNRLLLHVSGPTDSGQFVMFDRARRAMAFLGEIYPEHRELNFFSTIPIETRASDGQRLRSYLTVPSGAGPFPLVVMPHGGPEVRDYLTYDPVVQLFAAEGWVVLQTNFRGSSGYGKAFAEGGYRQWNGRVMLDIEEAMDSVLSTVPIDRAKVAVYGSSFGGYAALMAGTRRPQAYRSIVSLAGITDVAAVLRYERRASDDALVLDYMTRLMGDPNRDSRAIREMSPVNRAELFEAPVLLVHGEFDDRVPVEQGRSMNRRLRSARKTCKYIELKIGHGPAGGDELAAVFDPIISFIRESFR